MDAPLYDVYLTGKLTNNTTPAVAAQRLAALFKSTPEIMAGMLTGKPHLLKRGVDKNTALKYREALAGAGVEVAFKAQAAAGAAEITAIAPAPAVTAGAEKPAPEKSASGLRLAAPGVDVLQEHERIRPAAANIDTSEFQLAPVGPLPAAKPAAVAAIDIGHLSLAAAGGDLLSAAEKQVPPPLRPAVGDFTLAPAGAPLETLQVAPAPVHPDLSGLALAPAGTELLSAEQRAKPAVAVPSTDHIKLAN